MVAYLTNSRFTTVTRRESLCELGGLEYLLNPCARMDTQLYLVLELRVGYIIEYKYSVKQSPPGYYCYVKWWDVGTILWANPRWTDESKNTQVAPISTKSVFIAFPVFLVPQLSPLPGFGGLTLFHQRGDQKYRLCLDHPLLRLI